VKPLYRTTMHDSRRRSVSIASPESGDEESGASWPDSLYCDLIAPHTPTPHAVWGGLYFVAKSIETGEKIKI
jgi:hypothetical protein